MPLTTVDPNPALVVIDLQKGIVGAPTVHPIAEILSRTAEMARAFRGRKFPVILVHVTGRPPGRTDAGLPRMSLPPDWAEFVPEVEQTAGDHVVAKRCPGAFTHTNLDHYLRERGVTQIFLCGVATSVGVEATARNAYDLGYNVVLAVDAMTDRDSDNHRHSIDKTFPRLGECCITKDVLCLLATSSGG
jgi:nicotinamidase-related amidase